MVRWLGRSQRSVLNLNRQRTARNRGAALPALIARRVASSLWRLLQNPSLCQHHFADTYPPDAMGCCLMYAESKMPNFPLLPSMPALPCRYSMPIGFALVAQERGTKASNREESRMNKRRQRKRGMYKRFRQGGEVWLALQRCRTGWATKMCLRGWGVKERRRMQNDGGFAMLHCFGSGWETAAAPQRGHACMQTSQHAVAWQFRTPKRREL